MRGLVLRPRYDIADVSSGAWTALAAWLAVAAGTAALVYAWRQYQRAREEAAEVLQPQVAMFMEPSASDWHLIELVVKNFGRTPAYGIRFEFANPPTVGKYESAYEDRYVDIAPLNLPAEIPYLAPTQEWRIVWDSALDRRELGEAIASRFHGEVTYYDQPKTNGKGKARTQFRSTAVLDWATLHPVERLSCRPRTTGRQDDPRERYRAQYNAPVNNYHTLAQNNVDFEEAHTTVINGRHRPRLS